MTMFVLIGVHETLGRIKVARFDTEELAEAYVKAVTLKYPGSERDQVYQSLSYLGGFHNHFIDEWQPEKLPPLNPTPPSA